MGMTEIGASFGWESSAGEPEMGSDVMTTAFVTDQVKGPGYDNRSTFLSQVSRLLKLLDFRRAFEMMSFLFVPR
jgi:hypothetical protein